MSRSGSGIVHASSAAPRRRRGERRARRPLARRRRAVLVVTRHRSSAAKQRVRRRVARECLEAAHRRQDQLDVAARVLARARRSGAPRPTRPARRRRARRLHRRVTGRRRTTCRSGGARRAASASARTRAAHERRRRGLRCRALAPTSRDPRSTRRATLASASIGPRRRVADGSASRIPASSKHSRTAATRRASPPAANPSSPLAARSSRPMIRSLRRSVGRVDCAAREHRAPGTEHRPGRSAQHEDVQIGTIGDEHDRRRAPDRDVRRVRTRVRGCGVPFLTADRCHPTSLGAGCCVRIRSRESRENRAVR